MPTRGILWGISAFFHTLVLFLWRAMTNTNVYRQWPVDLGLIYVCSGTFFWLLVLRGPRAVGVIVSGFCIGTR